MQIELASLENERGEFAHTYEPEQLHIDDERVHLAGPVSVSGRIKRDGAVIKVEGKLQAQTNVECDRCLQPIEFPVNSDFSLQFINPQQYETLEASELSEADMDLSVLDGSVIDIDQIVEEQLLLAAPSQVLCKPDCKGFCAECGANLNLGDCGCQTSEIDPRWAALKNLIKDKS